MPTPPIICLPLVLKILTLLVTGLGGWLGLVVFQISLGQPYVGHKHLIKVVIAGSIWFIPFLRAQAVIYIPLKAGLRAAKRMDQG